MIQPITIVASYFVVWRLCLFLVLPFGVRNQVDAGEVVHGSEPGAPVRPLWLRRVLATTLLAIPVTALVLWGLSTPWLQDYWR